MDAIGNELLQKMLVEALGKAVTAEAIANKALSFAMDLMAEVKLLKTSSYQRSFDPIGPSSLDGEMELPIPSAPVKLSPFQMNFTAAKKAQEVLAKSNEELEKVTKDGLGNDQLWDEAMS